MWRYLEVSLNSGIKNQNVYNKILKKNWDMIFSVTYFIPVTVENQSQAIS
jgi:hypothetical protein